MSAQSLVDALVDAAELVEYDEGPSRIEGSPEDLADAAFAWFTSRLEDPRVFQAFRDAWNRANEWPDGPGRRVQAGLAAVAELVTS